jgi:hypothetical protein
MKLAVQSEEKRSLFNERNKQREEPEQDEHENIVPLINLPVRNRRL